MLNDTGVNAMHIMMVLMLCTLTPSDGRDSQHCFGSKKRNTALRQAKIGKHECSQIAIAY